MPLNYESRAMTRVRPVIFKHLSESIKIFECTVRTLAMTEKLILDPNEPKMTNFVKFVNFVINRGNFISRDIINHVLLSL